MLGGACILSPGAAHAATPVRLSGAITGTVRESGSNAPQMGAVVQVYNRQDRLIDKALTNDHGGFQFAGLLPDVYSIRVSLASFVPAIRKNILVQPGMRSILSVNLSNLFSTIQFSYPPIDNGSLMTDDWKWVLRSAPSTRPVLRFAEETASATATRQDSPSRSTAFSETRGIVKVSAGEGGLASGVGNEAGMGTAFAVATSLYGNSMLQVSGNVGYGSQTGVPTASFRTSYSRNVGLGSPEVSVTMRQLFMPARLGAAIAGNETALPMMRTMSAGYEDRTQVSDELAIQYGFTMDSVQFLDRLNYFSPYARLTYSFGDAGEIEFAYTSGNARPDLAGVGPQDTDLQRDLSTLALFPNISLKDGRSKVQRGQEFEMTYSRKVGARTYSATAYRESITNAAITVVAPNGLYSAGDILPDVFNGSAVFNAGDHQSAGYLAAVTQSLGEHVTATLMYGSDGVMTVDRRELVSENPDDLRRMIRAGRRHAATARIAATSPWTGTHMIASYQWSGDHLWAMPGNMYSTRSVRPMPGLNVYVRQPIPGLSILPWRIEATADLRNLLAQGYLPLSTPSGQSVLLVETPRSFRGGLSFIF
jgi:hypothetical protein